MENQTIRKFKLFFAWNDDKEEAWLSQMAREGWHLQSLGFPGSYTFTAGKPRNDVYRLDYIIDRKNYQNYLQLFQDSGWEHVGEMGNWQYFRTRQQGSQMPEIYTDKASNTQKYALIMLPLIVFLPIFVWMITRPISLESRFYDFYSTAKLAMSLIMMLYVYAMVRLLVRINRLKK
ncbi:MAG: DUF2812 domain-containing protein [Anaerolineae bacterium]|nr:DUF2812 domain-containing protein [Anaerolineae bacterium]